MVDRIWQITRSASARVRKLNFGKYVRGDKARHIEQKEGKKNWYGGCILDMLMLDPTEMVRTTDVRLRG